MSYYGPIWKRGSASTAGLVDLPTYKEYIQHTFYPAGAEVDFTFHPSGTVIGNGASNYTWLLSGAAADYELWVDIASSSGTAPSGTFNAWLPLSSARLYQSTRTLIGMNFALLNVKIRRVSDLAVLDTSQHVLQATCDDGA